MIRSIVIIGSLLLSGCVLTANKSGDLVSVKPTRAQLEAYAKTIVCKSFDPISYSQKLDTEITVAQILKFHEVLRSYGCTIKK